MGLAPEVFWRMSLPEWRAAVRGRFPPHTNEAMERAVLEQLMNRFPD